ncbi:ankyrin repeat domain-containing protein [Leptospira noumeaensis]|uniref:Ankyrin repeat domain-containing protein n=1 Tax=Leptospira noumeaensis TaxID=2484964 RepID=A0A4R9IH59_9LEPT|nr:ankyrin repeat domain-containing protein [Leptospira noumeaensis]TGK87740.1 ankyrin repeat domain-containing protein [Leptospira noumeaensis]
MQKESHWQETESLAWQEFQSTIPGLDPEKETAFRFARMGDFEGFSKEIPLPEALDWRDEKGNSLLMLASYHGHESFVSHLLGWGANPNENDHSGNSILMGAAFKGHLAVVSLLLNFGADPNYKNPQGFTALDYATMFGRGKVISILDSKVSNISKTKNKRLRLWIQYLSKIFRNHFLKNKKEAQV